MKKKITIIFTLILTLFLTSCQKVNKKYTIIATIYPEYDLVKEIIKDSDDFDLILLEQGSDLHSFSPSVSDIVNIKKCDLFIYVGGESDEWVDDVLKDTKNENMIPINLLEVLGDNALTEEEIEGMEEENEEEEEEEYDEHVWLSIKNMILFTRKIKEAIIKIDKENESYYETNANSFIDKLNQLDQRYESSLRNKIVDTLVVGDRFPFLYLVKDYNIKYYAAFKGCSANSEASFKTIIYLANKVDEIGTKYIIKIETSDGKIANQIKNNTQNKNETILTLNSMQSVDLKNYKTYLEIMESNLNVHGERASFSTLTLKK